MCGHIFVGYQGLQPLKQHHPLWRCSACGRQSAMPLDCCAQPAYDVAQPTPLIVSSIRWLGHQLSGIQERVRSWRMWTSQPDVDSVVAQSDLTPVLADEVPEPFNALDPDIELVTTYSELTEETSDRVHELQVS